MTITIQNALLTVDIDTLGAQLSSIRTPDGEEYLWQGDPEIWSRRAPILFPLIGRLKEGRYLLDGTSYEIPAHGFARDMEFSVIMQTGRSVSFCITDTPETRSVYPFSFSLTVTYTLDGTVLTKSHQIKNTDQRELLYELGAHDGFRTPVAKGSSMAGWSIRLPGLDQASLYGMDHDFMITPQGAPVSLNPNGLPLVPSVFGLDTMILDAPPMHQAVLCDHTGQARVTLSFPGFPYLGIWTQDKPFDTGFVCIEPWSSLPDCTFVGRELADKAGIRRLAPGQSEVLTYTTTIHTKER